MKSIMVTTSSSTVSPQPDLPETQVQNSPIQVESLLARGTYSVPEQEIKLSQNKTI